MAKNFPKIVNKGAYSGAGTGADNNKFNISRGATDGENSSNQDKRQYIYINIGDFAGAGVGASSNKFGGSQSSTNEDPHQIIQNAEIPDPDNSLPTYTGKVIGLVQSAVMHGRLIPYSNIIPKPDTFVVFSRSGVNFKWDRDPGSWLYLGVKYVGGRMDGNYGFCFYKGEVAHAKVQIDGMYKQVEVPFNPANLACKEKNQGIYYLEGSGYVWGWLYHPSPTPARTPTPAPNQVPQPKSNPALFAPRPKPSSFYPSSSSNSDMIKGNHNSYIPDSSNKPKPNQFFNIIKAMAVPTIPLPRNVKRVGNPSNRLFDCIIPCTLIPTKDQPMMPKTFVTFKSSAWDNNSWFHLVVEFHNDDGIFVKKYGFCFYDGRIQRAPKFNNVNEACYVPFPDKMATYENDQGFFLLKGRGYLWGFTYNIANQNLQSSDKYVRDEDNYESSSDDTNYGDDDGLLSDEDIIDQISEINIGPRFGRRTHV